MVSSAWRRSAAKTWARMRAMIGCRAGRAGAHPVGQGRDLDGGSFAGVDLTLPIERQVLAVFGGEHEGQQMRAGAAAGDRVGRCRRLGDALAIAARHGLAHVLDHLPASRLAFEALGDDLAELAQA